jgi:pimeloyl-ACP methyl ester carboxylesterase
MPHAPFFEPVSVHFGRAAERLFAVALGAAVVGTTACGPPADGAAHDEIVGAIHRFEEVGPTRWHFLEGGTGEAVVLLHGLPETSYAWRRQFNWLTTSRRVIAPDLEGFGLTRTTSEDASVDAMAGRLLDLLDAVGVDRFHLVGHDWGALIGARLAGSARGRLLSYVHVSGPLRRYDLSRTPDYRDFRRDPDSIPDLLRNPEIFVRRVYELGITAGPDSLSADLLARYTKALSNRESLAALGRYFAQLDVGPDWVLGEMSAPRWSEIEAPVRIILGGHDLLFPLEEYHDVTAVVPALERLEVLEGTGHYPHEEDPIRFGDVLYEFLESR